jgi:hypothetical protein
MVNLSIFYKLLGRKEMSATDTQVGGSHYKKFKIQPTEFITKNKIPFIEGCVIKYVVRWRDKNGLQDIDKAIHFLQLLKELENDVDNE